MKAKIKSFHCADIVDLYKFVPNNPECFCFLLELIIGPENSEGGEIFDIQICTPQWFLLSLKQDDIIFGRYFLVVLEYNFNRIFNKIKHSVESCSGNNWNEITRKLRYLYHWEFEDYLS
jgi:hypothetical protein